MNLSASMGYKGNHITASTLADLGGYEDTIQRDYLHSTTQKGDLIINEGQTVQSEKMECYSKDFQRIRYPFSKNVSSAYIIPLTHSVLSNANVES
jgi:hypothetical protein